MNKFEVQTILDLAYEKSFLDRIVFLKAQDKYYRKTDFYKKIKISLFTLFENYYKEKIIEEKISSSLNSFIETLDLSPVEKKIERLIEDLSENNTLNMFFERIREEFNIDNLLKNTKDLEGIIENFKK